WVRELDRASNRRLGTGSVPRSCSHVTVSDALCLGQVRDAIEDCPPSSLLQRLRYSDAGQRRQMLVTDQSLCIERPLPWHPLAERHRNRAGDELPAKHIGSEIKGSVTPRAWYCTRKSCRKSVRA